MNREPAAESRPPLARPTTRSSSDKGHYVTAEAIQGGDSAVLGARPATARCPTTDGPFIETKEQMAGFILIEARDLNEAVRLASGIPIAELGTIEVRPSLRDLRPR